MRSGFSEAPGTARERFRCRCSSRCRVVNQEGGIMTYGKLLFVGMLLAGVSCGDSGGGGGGKAANSDLLWNSTGGSPAAGVPTGDVAWVDPNSAVVRRAPVPDALDVRRYTRPDIDTV